MRPSTVVALLALALFGAPRGGVAQEMAPPSAETVWMPLQVLPPIGHDGHILLPGAVDVWRTAVQRFLAQIGLDRP